MKPHKGYLRLAYQVPCEGGYVYVGEFDGHPEFHRRKGHTSLVLKDDFHFGKDGFEIETLNSRYTVFTRRHALSGPDHLDTD